MNQEKEDFVKMLKEVGITANIVGVDKLTTLLKEIQKNHKDLTKEEYEKALGVISVVSECYGMTINDFYSNKRKNERKNALASVCFILYNYNKFNYKKISFVTRKSFEYISILMKEIEQMNPEHPFDKRFIKKLETIKLKLNND